MSAVTPSMRAGEGPGDVARAARYDAFISYSQGEHAQIAPALEAGLRQLARPWYRPRALRVFRDRTGLSVTPALWPAIESALASSRWLIHLASPKAAASDWVEKELRWWLEHRGTDRLLLVLTGGEAEWDDARNTFDEARSSAIAPVLRNAFAYEPRYLDLRWVTQDEQLSLRSPRFRDAVAELAAPLHGRTKDELDGEDLRQHKRTRRIARAAITSLVLLTVASVTTSVVAVQQRNLAQARHRIALARQLAAEATITIARSPARLPVALALAAEALGRDPSTEAERSLRDLLALRPRPLHGIDTGGTIMQVAFAGDGRWIAAADFDGGVAVWALPDSSASFGGLVRPDSLLLWVKSGDAPPRRLVAGGDVVAYAIGTSAWVRSAGTGEALVTVNAADTIHALDLGPAGRLLATGADDGIVQLWSLDDGSEVARLDHGDPVQAVAFSPDGRWLASIDEGGGFCLLDTRVTGAYEYGAAGEGELRCRGTGGTGLALAWSADSERIATTVENAALVWDLRSEEPLFRLEHVAGNVPAWQFTFVDVVAFSPDGRLIATGGRDFTARVWDTSAGREMVRLTHAGPVTAVGFTNDSRTVISASEDGTVRVWDARSGAERLRASHAFGATSFALDAAGHRLVTGARDGTIRTWELTGGDEVLRFPHGAALRALAASPDGSRFAVVDDDSGFVRIYSGDGRLLARVRPPGLRRTNLRFTTEDRLLAWRSNDIAAIERPAGGDSVRVSTLSRADNDVIALAPPFLVTENSGSESGLAVLSVETGETVARIPAPERGGSAAASPDGHTLAYERREGEIAIFELPSAREIHVVNAGGKAYTPRIANGAAALAADVRGRIHLWRLDESAPREVPLDSTAHAGELFPILSPDGERLLVLGNSMITVHDARTGRIFARLPHGDESVDAIRFAPDTAVIATVADGRVRIWELDSGRLIHELGGATIYTDASFTADGRFLITTDYDGYAVIRRWQTADVLRAACALLDAPLTAAEWTNLLPGEPYRPVCR